MAAKAPTGPAKPPAAAPAGGKGPAPRPSSPAGGRAPIRAVVLRTGPDPRKGRVTETVVAVVGLLLLVLSVALAGWLPVKDVAPTQFRVRFAPVTHNLTAQSFDFAEEGSGGEANHDFVFEVPHDNVYEVTLQVSFLDDVPASLPDTFRFELYRNDGEPVEAQSTAITNPLAGLAPNSTTEFQAVPAAMTRLLVVQVKPQDFIATVADPNVTAEQVASGVAAQDRLATTGTWKVRVHLSTAGDCPSPVGVPDPTEIARQAACRSQTSDDPRASGQDTGNPFTVGVFSYTRFEVHAERLG